jgi:hypothetical protein
MNKKRHYPAIAFLLMSLLLTETNLYAEGIVGPIIAGLSLIVIVGIIVGFVFALAYLIVWLFKRKK